MFASADVPVVVFPFTGAIYELLGTEPVDVPVVVFPFTGGIYELLGTEPVELPVAGVNG